MAGARAAPVAVCLAVDNGAVVGLQIGDRILVGIVTVRIAFVLAIEAHQVVIVDQQSQLLRFLCHSRKKQRGDTWGFAEMTFFGVCGIPDLCVLSLSLWGGCPPRIAAVCRILRGVRFGESGVDWRVRKSE